MDLFFTALFFCEMSTKIIAFGFACNGKDAYIKQPVEPGRLCHRDDLAGRAPRRVRPAAAPTARAAHVMRVLRPLRLISRNAGMKLIITSLFQAMPAVGNVFGVIFVLQIVFVILGMQLFSGTFATCNNPQIPHASCASITRRSRRASPLLAPQPARTVPLPDAGARACSECRIARSHQPAAAAQLPTRRTRWRDAVSAVSEGRRRRRSGTALSRCAGPTRSFGSFDNFGDAMRLLYIMSSGDQWEQPMFAMMGAQEPGVAPSATTSRPMALFAIAVDVLRLTSSRSTSSSASSSTTFRACRRRRTARRR